MKELFIELFEYNIRFNQKIISALSDNGEKISERCVQLVSHIVNVHQVWNCKFTPGQKAYAAWQIHLVEDLSEIDRKNYQQSIFILNNFELSRPIQYSTSTGQILNNSMQDILFQIINHSTYHRGQIATEFRQSGIETLLTDYIFYKMS